ncbi:unnamed protein product [Diatraea saccharalis]|uniref:Uncharacterized protein n=1 Tax=Diatraea saccharalis TaxID=40085 RepID=A0A9N9QSS2_9NEOP|nr:unnamed protein product [Diatraea saccharalis]
MLFKKKKKYYKDCKVIPGEAITTQHRLLIAVMDLLKLIKVYIDRTVRLKWKELHSCNGSQLLEGIKLYLRKDVNTDKLADKMWSDFESFTQSYAKSILGVFKCSLPTR